MKSNHFMLSGIEDLHEQYLNLPRDELAGKVLDEFHHLDLVYMRTSEKWQELWSSATGTTSRIENVILPTLLTHGMKQLDQDLESFDLELRSQHYSTVSKDQLAAWTKKTKALRQNYNQLRTGICGGLTTLSATQLGDAHKKIVQLDDSVKAIETRMAKWRQIEQQRGQTNVYVDRATSAIQYLLEQQTAIDSLDFTDQTTDAACIIQETRKSFRQAMDGVQELENLYEDLWTGTQQTLQTCDDDFQVPHIQSQANRLAETRSKLRGTIDMATQSMGLVNRWLDLYSDLKEVRQTVIGCKTTLDTLLLRTDGHDESMLLDKLEKHLHMVLPRLKNEPSGLDQPLLTDKYHFGLYSSYYQETLGLLNAAQKLVENRRLSIGIVQLTRQYQDTIEQRRQICLEQKSALERQDQVYEQLPLHYRVDGYPASKLIDTPGMLKSGFVVLDCAKGVVAECKNDLQLGGGDINALYEQLTGEFGQSHEKMVDMQQPLVSLLDALDSMIAYQEQQHWFIGSIEAYDGNATELLGTISQLHTSLSSLETLDADAYTEVTQQHTALKENMDLFTPFVIQEGSDEEKAVGMASTLGDDPLYQSCLGWLGMRYQDVMKNWAQCCDTLDNHRQRLLEDQQKQQNSSQMEGLMEYMGEMEKRVNTLHLSGCQNIEAEHQELGDIDKEFLDTLCPRIDAILDQPPPPSDDNSEASDNSRTHQQLRASLQQSRDGIKLAIEMKKADAHDQDETLRLVGDINGLERVIDLVDESIAAAAPHHSRIVNGSFVKSDLQDLLNELVKSYKAHSMAVGPLFESLQGKIVQVPASSSVDLLQAAKRHWTKTKEAAAARERELQMCIEQLQNDFFTKLAIIGKTQHQRQQQRQSPLSLEPSSPSSSAFSYNVDRENSLDVQIGQVLKNQPYRTKIKMVPGQVGKYWIGDKNPRLVYCRILKSKVVMVRVGGGKLYSL